VQPVGLALAIADVGLAILPLAPSLGSLWGGRNIIASGRPTSGTVATVNNVLLKVTGAVMFLSPLAFLVYAFFVLFDRFGAGDPLVWLAFGAAVVSLARALIALAYWKMPPA
jgi:hypothetical protein